MLARTLMVQGTASSAGKSLLVTALCRIFRHAGLRVAPFKAQNMALNAAVTADGLEIGRAQAVQAEAAGVEPTVDMNPVLLKPEGDRRCQVVLRGRAAATLDARDYYAGQAERRTVVVEALERLRGQYDLVVIEGAGSPAEPNLKARDIANMFVAKLADAPVLLVGDIDRGGVFASLLGTLMLLDEDERARVAALVLNKFRGDIGLLLPGLSFLEERTGKPVLGVVPHIPALQIADEDSVSVDGHRARRGDGLTIAIVRLPRLSNHDEFSPLVHEPGVTLRYAERPEEAAGADLVILPGSKSTVADLAWVRETGFAQLLAARARAAAPTLAICGGCEMLGERILDPHGVESPVRETAGLGILPLRTVFAAEKTTARCELRAALPSFLIPPDATFRGYEIHNGQVEATAPVGRPFLIVARNGAATALGDGAVDASGAVVGTMLHGLFENDAVRKHVLDGLRARRGLVVGADGPRVDREAEYDRLAAVVGAHLDRDRLFRIAGVEDRR